MAPRRQVKQAAAESTLAAADGNVTPPKKRKTAARSSETPKEAKSKAAPRQTRRAKALQEAAVVLTPKNLRSRNNANVVVAGTTKNPVPKTDAASKTKTRVSKRQKEKTTMGNDDVNEEVVEEKMRGKSVKKAGTKPKTAKAPVARKRRGEIVDEVEGLAENGEVVVEENPPVVKRATRRGKAVEEENVAPVTMKIRAEKDRKSPKRQRMRRNAQAKVPAEADDDTPEEKENEEVIVASKKPRERVKKTAKVAAKERLPKDSVKEELELSEEEKTETAEEQSEQNTTEEDKLKTNMKNTKKRNAKKAISKGKRNVETEENNEAEAEEPIIPEIEENGETEIPQAAEAKQKKRNAGKANAATNEKIETKKREKKGQTVTSINEKKETKDIVVKDEIMNLTFDALGEINIPSISLNKSNDLQEENNGIESTVTENNDVTLKLESSNNELGRSATFLCLD